MNRHPLNWPPFTTTPWATPEDKRRFADRFVAFVEAGFPVTRFNKKFYRQLCQMFGHIAHFDRDGFYAAFFTSAHGKLEFIEHLFGHWVGVGDPAATWSDVEQAIAEVAEERGWLERASREAAEAVRRTELTLLADLAARYPDEAQAAALAQSVTR